MKFPSELTLETIYGKKSFTGLTVINYRESSFCNLQQVSNVGWYRGLLVSWTFVVIVAIFSPAA
ncbi:hypothetical protein JCM10914A_45670 [Paenibacillus sp. JCM 10914]|uniref:hypothetical protein n=1 Tax=Paenibacillus sp. JCM 10914 TaxID=1236974 RepID=UPI0003CCA203|nr:hypothetical protein [Paenibacillus sp. JCM 10914]GAE09790.1 hypothetical protein JCM10914_6177 [Paenibacillus sp. JCM 10914]